MLSEIVGKGNKPIDHIPQEVIMYVYMYTCMHLCAYMLYVFIRHTSCLIRKQGVSIRCQCQGEGPIPGA